jgi:hypothetical protein
VARPVFANMIASASVQRIPLQEILAERTRTN